MYGDTRVVRGLAATLRDQAGEIAHEADDLVALAEECPWSGWAADAMRRRSRERAAVLRRTAGDHRDAADALAHHADEVDRVKELIAAIETKVLGLVAAARDRLGELVREVLPDRADELLDRFVPPPSGHRAWLDVDLPGLRR
ncbi:MAG: hypothetical protein ACR2JD_01770 [Nocardioides sp.]